MKREIENYKFVFIAGLHKSGTTVLADCLKEHPLISGFTDTGVPRDEGQFLQSVFPIAREYGGPGKFGFRKEMHLTEKSPLVTDENRKKIFREWSRYWDLSKPLLLEKSPPNILKTRFLQALFPNSYFVLMTRHPVANSYATEKWSKTSIYSLLQHWIACHEIFHRDRKYIQRLLVTRYEDFVKEPDSSLDKIYLFLNAPHHKRGIVVQGDENKKYYKKWQAGMGKDSFRLGKLEKKIRKQGYSLYNLE